MRARLAFILTVVALISVLGGTAAAGSPAPVQPTAPSSQVAVRVTVQPVLESTFVDDGVIVRSNTPWTVSAELPSGDRVAIFGEPTDGEHVCLPDAAGAIEVCAR